MAEMSATQTGGRNVRGFLGMLTWLEGADCGRQPTRDRGSDVLAGGKLFCSYADRSRVLVDHPKSGIHSTAAGRYQLLRRYYGAYRKTLNLCDFSPLSQGLRCSRSAKSSNVCVRLLGLAFRMAMSVSGGM